MPLFRLPRLRFSELLLFPPSHWGLYWTWKGRKPAEQFDRPRSTRVTEKHSRHGGEFQHMRGTLNEPWQTDLQHPSRRTCGLVLPSLALLYPRGSGSQHPWDFCSSHTLLPEDDLMTLTASHTDQSENCRRKIGLTDCVAEQAAAQTCSCDRHGSTLRGHLTCTSGIKSPEGGELS